MSQVVFIVVVRPFNDRLENVVQALTALQMGAFFWILGDQVNSLNPNPNPKPHWILGGQVKEVPTESDSLDMGASLNNLMFLGCFVVVANTFKGQLFGGRKAFVENRDSIKMAIQEIQSQVRRAVHGGCCAQEDYQPHGPLFEVPSVASKIQENAAYR